MSSYPQRLGLSTGCFHGTSLVGQGAGYAREQGVSVVEFNALGGELFPQQVTDAQTATGFERVSLHAPTVRLTPGVTGEKERSDLALSAGVPVIVHPDVVVSWENWVQLSGNLLVENMDKRKPSGQSVQDIKNILLQVPEANLCFDLSHAYDVGGEKLVAEFMETFTPLIKQVHFGCPCGNDTKLRLQPDLLKVIGRTARDLPDVPFIYEGFYGKFDEPFIVLQEELGTVSKFLNF